MKLRWGIASAGKIAHDFVAAINTFSDEEHYVTAIADLDIERSQQFAEKHGIPVSYNNFEELANNPEIDIVYIAVLNPQHDSVARSMLENGKHCLIEPPMCMNRQQANNLMEFAKEKKLFLMEGIWSRFFPSYQFLRNAIQDGSLGELKEVEVSMGFDHSKNVRITEKDLGGDSVIDMGVYCVQMCLWCFNEEPTQIIAHGHLDDHGIDLTMDAELEFSNDRKATIYIDLTALGKNHAIIKGTKGKMIVHLFWAPMSLIDVEGNEQVWDLPKAKWDTFFPNSIGLRYEAEAIRNCIMNGDLECEIVSHADSLQIVKVEDEIRRQIGVIFQEDNVA